VRNGTVATLRVALAGNVQRKSKRPMTVTGGPYTLRKTTPATRSYGRGNDARKTPPTYAVIDSSGKTVGSIVGTAYPYGGRPEYYFISEGREVQKFNTFAKVKEWATTRKEGGQR
jgi:hypothetical protein